MGMKKHVLNVYTVKYYINAHTHFAKQTPSRTKKEKKKKRKVKERKEKEKR